MAGYAEAADVLEEALTVAGFPLSTVLAHPTPDGGSAALSVANTTPPAAAALALLARCKFLAGDYVRARAVLDIAVPAAEAAAHGEPSEALGLALRVSGNAFEKIGEYDAALGAFTRALAVRESLLGPAHPDVVAVRCNIAATLGAAGRLEASRAAYEAALALALRGSDANAPCVGVVRNGLALVQWRLGDVVSAADNFETALRIRTRAYGAEHPLCGATLNNLGLVQARARRYAEAVATTRRALAVRAAALGDKHLDVARSQHNLGSALEGLAAAGDAAADDATDVTVQSSASRYAEAAAAFAAAAATRRACFGGRDHALVVESLVALARSRLCAGDLTAATAAAIDARDAAARLASSAKSRGFEPGTSASASPPHFAVDLLDAPFFSDARYLADAGDDAGAADALRLGKAVLALVCGDEHATAAAACATTALTSRR